MKKIKRPPTFLRHDGSIDSTHQGFDDMLTGKSGRLMLALIFLASAVPLVAAGDQPLSQGVDECEQVGDIAELVMRVRQDGGSMDELVRIERTFPEEQHGIVEVASIAAFQFPLGTTTAERELAIRDFRVWMQEHFCEDAVQ